MFKSDFYSQKIPNKDNSWWGAARYSVTKLTTALSDFTVLVWVVLAVKTSPFSDALDRNCLRIAMISVQYCPVNLRGLGQKANSGGAFRVT